MAGVGCGSPRRTHSLHAVPALSILVLAGWLVPSDNFLKKLHGARDCPQVNRKRAGPAGIGRKLCSA